MTLPVRVALDGYGGDHGLSSTVPGALLAVESDPDLTVLLVADGQAPPHRRIEPVPSGGALPDGGHPATLLRSHPDLSIALATRLVAEGAADAVVSMGHTGATMIAARWFLKTVDGVGRTPAATRLPLPLPNRPVLLDLGATADVSARDLAGFAALGTAYSQIVAGIPRPRVALLSNGTEEGKGTQVIRDAYAILKASNLDFRGYVEPVSLVDNPADVLVTEGFTGNLLIKWMEGTARMFLETYPTLLRGDEGRRFQGDLLAMTDVTSSNTDPVLILGTRGVVVPGHGRSGPEDVARAVRNATEAVRGGLTAKVLQALSRIRGKE